MTWAVENFWYRSENRVNPYNQGAVRNFREILCTKIPASKTDFRAKVERETSRQMVGIPSNIDDQDDTGNLRTKIDTQELIRTWLLSHSPDTHLGRSGQ